MKIRPVTVDDTASLAFLRQERQVLLQQSDARLQMPPIDFTAILSGSDYRVYVGDHDGRVSGYIVGSVNHSVYGDLPDGVGCITEMTLDAHKYHGGLGRLLYLQLKAWFDQVGVSRMIVLVPRYHAVEQAFWRSLGAIQDSDPLFFASPAQVWMKLKQ